MHVPKQIVCRHACGMPAYYFDGPSTPTPRFNYTHSLLTDVHVKVNYEPTLADAKNLRSVSTAFLKGAWTCKNRLDLVYDSKPCITITTLTNTRRGGAEWKVWVESYMYQYQGVGHGQKSRTTETQAEIQHKFNGHTKSNTTKSSIKSRLHHAQSMSTS